MAAEDRASEEEGFEEESQLSADTQTNVLDSETGEEHPTEEELDELADTGIEVLRQVLSHFDSEGAEINEYEGDDGELILDVVGGNLAVLIGRRGRTLDALQVLVSTIAHHRLDNHYRLTVDVESYKQRQREKLENMAYSAASRADRQNRDINLRPMNPYERRIVHMALRDDDRVETYSVGVDPDRYVVVHPLSA